MKEVIGKMQLRDIKTIVKALKEVKQVSDSICNTCADRVLHIFVETLKKDNPSFNETKFREEVNK